MHKTESIKKAACQTPAMLHAKISEQKDLAKAKQEEYSPVNFRHRDAKLTPLTATDGVDIIRWVDSNPPDRTYIIEELIPAGIPAVVNSPGGVGKSTLLFLKSMCVATAIDVPPFKVSEPKRVLLMNVEDSYDDLWRKFKAIITIYPEFLEKIELLKENLIIWPGKGKLSPFMQLDNGNPVVSPHGEWIHQSMLNIQPSLAIFDTKSRLYGLDENSNDHAARWWGLFESIITEIPGCTVLVASHSAKARSDDTSQLSNRGASAFIDNARLNIVLNHMTEQEARTYRVNRFDYFSMHNSKANYGKQGGKVFFKKLDEGVPKMVDLNAERFNAALDVLKVELNDLGGRIGKRDLTDKDPGKEIRQILKDDFKLTKSQFRRLVEYGIESCVFEQITVQTTAGRESIDLILRHGNSLEERFS